MSEENSKKSNKNLVKIITSCMLIFISVMMLVSQIPTDDPVIEDETPITPEVARFGFYNNHDVDRYCMDQLDLGRDGLTPATAYIINDTSFNHCHLDICFVSRFIIFDNCSIQHINLYKSCNILFNNSKVYEKIDANVCSNVNITNSQLYSMTIRLSRSSNLHILSNELLGSIGICTDSIYNCSFIENDATQLDFEDINTDCARFLTIDNTIVSFPLVFEYCYTTNISLLNTDFVKIRDGIYSYNGSIDLDLPTADEENYFSMSQHDVEFELEIWGSFGHTTENISIFSSECPEIILDSANPLSEFYLQSMNSTISSINEILNQSTWDSLESGKYVINTTVFTVFDIVFTYSTQVFKDIDPATIDITYPTNYGIYGIHTPESERPKFTFACTDNVGMTRYEIENRDDGTLIKSISLDNVTESTFVFDSNEIWEQLFHGNNYYVVNVWDIANTTSSKQFAFYIDGEGPELTILIEDTIFSASEVSTIPYEIQSNEDAYNVMINNNPISEMTGILNESITSTFVQGDNIIYISSEDEYGNYATTSYTICVDLLFEEIRVNGFFNGQHIDSIPENCEIIVNDEYFDTANYSLVNNGVILESFQLMEGINPFNISQSTWSSLPNGDFTIIVSCKDTTGNYRTETFVLIKDTVAPVLSIISPVANTLYNVMDNLPEFEISVQGEQEIAQIYYYFVEKSDSKIYLDISPISNFSKITGEIDAELWKNCIDLDFDHLTLVFVVEDMAGNVVSNNTIILVDYTRHFTHSVTLAIWSSIGVFTVALFISFMKKKNKFLDSNDVKNIFKST